MELLSSLFFTAFLFLGIYVFFYELIMAILRRFQLADPVPVGTPPPYATDHRDSQEQLIAEIGARRREERQQELHNQLTRQFQIWDSRTNGGLQGRRATGRTVLSEQLHQFQQLHHNQQLQQQHSSPPISAEELERRRVVYEQDIEYQRALAADSERIMAEQRQEQESERQRAIEEQQRQEAEARISAERQRQHQLREQRLHALQYLPKEPSESHPESVDPTVELAIRLPTGQRISRKFWATDKLADLRCYIEGNFPELTEHYRIVFGAGRAKTILEGLDTTLDELGLAPRALLIVDDSEPELK